MEIYLQMKLLCLLTFCVSILFDSVLSTCDYHQVGQPYTGTLDKTRNGHTCQRWDTQYPHQHIYTNETLFPDRSLEDAGNFCREPSKLHYIMKRPWCYVNESGAPEEWEFCDIPEVECFNGGWFNETSCKCECDSSRYGGDSCDIVFDAVEALWPTGSYALPMSSYGCPPGDVWTKGGLSLSLQEELTGVDARDTFWRYHYNYMGPYEPGNFIHNFCVTDFEPDGELRSLKSGSWMPGSYCIYRVNHNCPIGSACDVLLSSECSLMGGFYHVTTQCGALWAGIDEHLGIVDRTTNDPLVIEVPEPIPTLQYSPRETSVARYMHMDLTKIGRPDNISRACPSQTTELRKTSETNKGQTLNNPGVDKSSTKMSTHPKSSGFYSTSVVLNPESDTRRTSYGALPDVTSSGPDIELFFCCRRDGPLTSPIILPYSTPFYLLKESSVSGCQTVEHMKATEELFPVHETLTRTENVTGPRPDLFSASGISLHLCFYQNYEIPACYDPRDHGMSYRGTARVTLGNVTCDPWENQPDRYFVPTGDDRYFFQYIGLEGTGYCRLPDQRDRPFCYHYAELTNTAWDYCDIKPCPVPAEQLPNLAVGKLARFSTLRYPSSYGSQVVDGLDETCAASSPESSPWLQIDLQSIHIIKSVELIINRILGTDPLLRHLDIHVGMTSEDFKLRGATLCRHDITLGIGISAWFDCVQPIRGQYLTIQNTVFYDGHWSSQASVLRMCELKVFGYATYDGLPLGMASRDLPSSALTVSSYATGDVRRYSSRLKKYDARIYTRNDMMKKGGWCADKDDSDMYFMVDLGRVRKVESIVTRGLDTYGKDAPGFYTSVYAISTSVNQSETHNIYTDGLGQVKNFTGNFDNFTPVRNVLNPPIIARFFKINILNFTGYPCLRFELFGQKDETELNCDKPIQHPTSIQSPKYPGYYGENRYCVWDIIFPSGTFVVLEFSDIDLEPKDYSRVEGDYTVNPGDCQDTVRIQTQAGDGSWMYVNNLTHGSALPRIVSASHRMRVEMITCFLYSLPSATGFKAEVNRTECAGYGVGHSVCPSVHMCTSPCGYLASVNYPSNYPHQHTCHWHIKISPGKYVALRFLHFDILNKNGDCSDDYLEIEDVDVSGRRSSLGRFCTGMRVPEDVLYSSKNEMYLTLFTDKDTSASGFLATYTEYLYNVSGDIYRTWQRDRLKCAQGWEGFDDSCYRLYRTNKTSWIRAENLCQAEGGHLVSIRDRTESSFIHFLLTTVWQVNETNVYFGLNDRQREGHYEWSDGSQLTFTDWYVSTEGTKASQPNGGEQEDCGVIILGNIQSTSYWHDIACANDDVSQFICEKPWSGKTFGDKGSGSAHVHVWNNMTGCSSSQYTCYNGECISVLFQCDGHPDCWDGSDESHCDTECGPLGFTCDNGDCISVSFYCDFKMDCKDESDEVNCVRRECHAWEFQCDNGQCIPAEERCDIQLNCEDGSDERACAFCRPDISFKCYDGRCIPKSAECDGQVDCSGLDHEDESEKCAMEAVKRSCGEWRESGFTKSGLYDVLPRGTGKSTKVECIFEDVLGRAVSVFHHDVENRSHVNMVEWNYIRKFSYLQTTYEDVRAMVTMADYCDMYMRYECKGSMLGKDAGSVVTYNGTNVNFHSPAGNCDCLLTGNCQPISGRCMCDKNNGRVWLEDYGYLNNSDMFPLLQVKFGDTGSSVEEAYHTIGPLKCYEAVKYNKARVTFVCRNKKMVNSDVRCLHQYDQYGYVTGCRDLSHLDDCESHRCPANWYKCPGAFCIPYKMLCDGRQDCPCGSDETKCANYSCPGMYRCHKSSNCITSAQVCDGNRDCNQGDDEHACDVICPPSCTCQGLSVECMNGNYSDIPVNISANTRNLNLSYNRLSEVEFNCSLSELGQLSLAHCHISVLVPGTFKCMRNLYHLDLGYNQIVQLAQRTFVGLSNLRYLNLLGNRVLRDIEPRAFVGLTQLPTLAITGTQLGAVKANMFEGLKNLTHLYLNSNKISYIEEGGFEHLEHIETLEMQANAITRYPRKIFFPLGKLNRFSSDSYAFCCLAFWVPKTNCLPERDQLSSCEDLMRILPLRMALWIVGAIALLANIFVIIYRTKHPERSKVNGLILTNLAISDFLMGVYLIFIAVVDTRYKGEYFMHAEHWTSSLACHLAGALATVSLEVSMLTLACLTLDRFTNILFPFGQYKLNKKSAKGLLVLVWCVAVGLAGIPLLPIPYFKGQFYSRTGVCIPLHLTTSSYPGWEYSIAIFMGLNTAIFTFIAVGYWYIYLAIKQTSIQKIRSKGQTKTETVAARKMAVLVFTNVLCWFPTFIIGCLVLSGVSLDADVYAWTVVFVLPVNSAMDPILYTIAVIKKSHCADKTKTVASRLSMSGGEDLFPFNSFQSETVVKTKENDVQRYVKDETVELSIFKRHIPSIKNKFTLSTCTFGQLCTPEDDAADHVTLSHAIQHSSHLDGHSMQNEALVAFTKSLGKTLINLHKSALTLDWQNYRVTFTDIEHESTTVMLEGECIPILNEKTMKRDAIQFQQFVKKLYRERSNNADAVDQKSTRV